MKRCIVIDDEPLAVKLITNYIMKHPDLQLIKSFTNPIIALHEIETLKIDLIFLDIQMPELTGIQFLKIIKDKTSVILTTAYDQYALESYNYHVTDYLVKPINYSRFEKAVTRYLDTKEKVNHDQNDSILKKKTLESIFVKSGLKKIRIDLSELLYLESKGDYLHLIFSDKELTTLENLKNILQRLSSNFIQCHRSFIVNMDNINYIENKRMVIGKTYIPISKRYLGTVENYIQEK